MGTIPNYNDIIAYRPNLEPTRTVQSDIPTNEYYSGPNLNINSDTVLQLSDNRPSYVINSLNRSVDSVNSMIDALATSIPNTVLKPIQQALIGGDYNKVDDLLKQYSADINSNTGIEIYNRLYRLKNEIQGFNSLYTKLNYGGAISFDKAITQEDDSINTLLEYETDINKVQYINYGALNVDVQLNKLASVHADTLNGYANMLYGMTVDTGDDGKIDNTSDYFKPTIESFFNKAVCNNDSETTKLDSLINSGTINNSLYSVYSKRKDMLNSIRAVADIDNVENDELLNTLYTYLGEAVTNTYDSISDFQKTVNMSAMYRDDYLNSLKTKEDLRNIYNLN